MRKKQSKHTLVFSPRTRALWVAEDGLPMAEWRQVTGDPDCRPVSPPQVA